MQIITFDELKTDYKTPVDILNEPVGPGLIFIWDILSSQNRNNYEHYFYIHIWIIFDLCRSFKAISQLFFWRIEHHRNYNEDGHAFTFSR